MDFSIHICEYNRSNADYDIIYRPEGSGDYLFLLFKTPMRVYAGKQFSITQENISVVCSGNILQKIPMRRNMRRHWSVRC